jgi:hypothetical protein
MEAEDQAWVTSCEIYCEPSGTSAGFPLEYVHISHPNYDSTIAYYHISILSSGLHFRCLIWLFSG